jgi:hypothetical protein
MNSDEIGSFVRKLMLIGLTALATRLHMSDTTWVVAAATDLADLTVLGWGVYSHWGMKKVPA